jgi:hypothetical protein
LLDSVWGPSMASLSVPELEQMWVTSLALLLGVLSAQTWGPLLGFSSVSALVLELAPWLAVAWAGTLALASALDLAQRWATSMEVALDAVLA